MIGVRAQLTLSLAVAVLAVGLAAGHATADSEASESAESAHDQHHREGGDGPMRGMDAGHMERMEASRAALREKLGAAYGEPVRSAQAGELERGAELFRSYCVACHGDAGKGDGPAAAGLDPSPADFTDPAHATFYSDRARIEIIRGGSPGTAMPPFSATLDEAEIMAVFQFIRSLRGG